MWSRSKYEDDEQILVTEREWCWISCSVVKAVKEDVEVRLLQVGRAFQILAWLRGRHTAITLPRALQLRHQGSLSR